MPGKRELLGRRQAAALERGVLQRQRRRRIGGVSLAAAAAMISVSAGAASSRARLLRVLAMIRVPARPMGRRGPAGTH